MAEEPLIPNDGWRVGDPIPCPECDEPLVLDTKEVGPVTATVARCACGYELGVEEEYLSEATPENMERLMADYEEDG